MIFLLSAQKFRIWTICACNASYRTRPRACRVLNYVYIYLIRSSRYFLFLKSPLSRRVLLIRNGACVCMLAAADTRGG